MYIKQKAWLSCSVRALCPNPGSYLGRCFHELGRWLSWSLTVVSFFIRSTSTSLLQSSSSGSDLDIIYEQELMGDWSKNSVLRGGLDDPTRESLRVRQKGRWPQRLTMFALSLSDEIVESKSSHTTFPKAFNHRPKEIHMTFPKRNLFDIFISCDETVFPHFLSTSWYIMHHMHREYSQHKTCED